MGWGGYIAPDNGRKIRAMLDAKVTAETTHAGRWVGGQSAQVGRLHVMCQFRETPSGRLRLNGVRITPPDGHTGEELRNVESYLRHARREVRAMLAASKVR